ncbi:hypothetical protein [Sphingomonas sp. LHG3406-1]|uniref:hypothetical protein n=1 Tax=Sphingomonas sp. LHG3406-1 TaxID=2804617 RepID=UPI0026178BE9|nr:hypothetical protein [Sphingomonas sp. LHG3406-1]
MRRAVAAGLAYGFAAFLLGFLLGTIRVLFVASSIGETAATLIELPLMLGAGWFACAWLVRRLLVPSEARPRLIMGLTAFALLATCERVFGLTLFDRSHAEQVAALRTTAGSLGLCAQLLFAALPVVRLMAEKRGGRGRD